MTSPLAPLLEGEALGAVRHRGSHLQIIASAGSGKTEVVSQRFADLMVGGADPAGIIAFTFTERAAESLKARISARVEQRLGAVALDRLGAAFVGTIHAYCFRLLQQHVPRYETFDVLGSPAAMSLCPCAAGSRTSAAGRVRRAWRSRPAGRAHRPVHPPGGAAVRQDLRLAGGSHLVPGTLRVGRGP